MYYNTQQISQITFQLNVFNYYTPIKISESMYLDQCDGIDFPVHLLHPYNI